MFTFQSNLKWTMPGIGSFVSPRIAEGIQCYCSVCKYEGSFPVHFMWPEGAEKWLIDTTTWRPRGIRNTKG